MPKIPFSNPFGKKAANKQSNSIVATVVSELLQDPPQTPVATPPVAPIVVQHSVRSSRKYLCESCPGDLAKSYGSAIALMDHVKNEHPSQWPVQLLIPRSKTYAKKWKVGQVKTVMDTYLQLRATQNVGRHFVIRRTKKSRDAYWIDCSEQPETSSLSHIKALNAASVAVGRSAKSVREILNADLAVTNGSVKHQPILVRQPGGKGPQCELTSYGLKRIKQIRDKCGYTGFGGIEGLKELQSTKLIMSNANIQESKQSDPVMGDPAVIKPQETEETEVTNLVWKDEPSNIVSTWAGLTQGVLKYVSELQQQVSDLKNQDQNRINQDDTFIKEMEVKDRTIAEKDSVILGQKEHIVELNNQNSDDDDHLFIIVTLSNERDELQIQLQNLTEERDTLLTANEALVQQAKAHNKEKQSATLAKKVDVNALEGRMSKLVEDLENMKKNLE